MRTLRSQFNRLIAIEEQLPDTRRSTSQWQVLTTVGKHNVIVGKGGMNTIFYQIGNQEMCYVYPHQMKTILNTWVRTGYLFYVIARDKKVLRTYKTLNEAKSNKAETYVGSYLVGVGETNRRLFRLRKTLLGVDWEKVK